MATQQYSECLSRFCLLVSAPSPLHSKGKRGTHYLVNLSLYYTSTRMGVVVVVVVVIVVVIVYFFTMG